MTGPITACILCLNLQAAKRVNVRGVGGGGVWEDGGGSLFVPVWVQDK